MSALICHACGRVIGNVWSRHVWLHGEPVHPGCVDAENYRHSEPSYHKTFMVGKLTLMRCVCQRLVLLSKNEYVASACACGRTLWPQSEFDNGSPDPNSLHKKVLVRVSTNDTMGWPWYDGHPTDSNPIMHALQKQVAPVGGK